MESCVFCVALLRTKYQQIILVCKATHISAHNNPILLDLGIRYAAAIGPCERQIKVGKHSWDEPKDHWPCRSYVQRCIRAKLGTCASYVLPLWHETNYNKVDRGRKDDVILGVFCPVLSCQNTICWNSKEISYAFIDCRSLRWAILAITPIDGSKLATSFIPLKAVNGRDSPTFYAYTTVFGMIMTISGSQIMIFVCAAMILKDFSKSVETNISSSHNLHSCHRVSSAGP